MPGAFPNGPRTNPPPPRQPSSGRCAGRGPRRAAPGAAARRGPAGRPRFSPWLQCSRRPAEAPLTPYQFIDLDTDAPDWGVTDEDLTGDTDIGIDSSPSLYTANDAEVAVMPELPSFDDCRRATALTTGLTPDQTAPSTHLCVRTSGGAYAYVGIVQVVNDPVSVTIDITVWSS